jgi:hypothetical protein
MSLSVIFLLTASLVSCSDKNLGGPKSRSELLTTSPWYLEKYEQKTDNNPWVNNYASITKLCERQLLSFSNNKHIGY